MLLNRKPSVKQLKFQCSYDSGSVPYSVWLSSASSPITTVVFLGTVQIGKLPAWIARHCPEGVAVVQGAPHWIAKEDGSDLSDFMRTFTEHAFKNVLNLDHENKMHVIVDSQATPNVLELLSQDDYIDTLESLVLVQPLGLNPQAFKKDRVATFKKRVTKNLRHQLPFLVIDRKLLYNHRQILRMVGFANAKTNAQYNVGLMTDGARHLKKLCTSHIPITIICGRKDEIFPPHEIRANLLKNRLDIPVIVVKDAPHSPLPTKQGMRLFDRALAALTEKN